MFHRLCSHCLRFFRDGLSFRVFDDGDSTFFYLIRWILATSYCLAAKLESPLVSVAGDDRNDFIV